MESKLRKHLRCTDAGRRVPTPGPGRTSASTGSPEKVDLALIEDYFHNAVKFDAPDPSRITLPDYMHTSYGRMTDFDTLAGFQSWQRSHGESISQFRERLKPDQQAWVAPLDSEIANTSARVQLPLMLRLMKQAGMPFQTCHFIREGFTKGFKYVGQIPLTGSYFRVPEGNELGEFERIPCSYVERPTNPDRKKKLFDARDFKTPGKLVMEICDATKKELVVDPKGVNALPFRTYLGPYIYQGDLPTSFIHPAFRFWVEQCTSTGADPGRVVDDLTASGGNGVTPIREKLWLPTLEHFIEMTRHFGQPVPARP